MMNDELKPFGQLLVDGYWLLVARWDFGIAFPKVVVHRTASVFSASSAILQRSRIADAVA